MGRGFRHLDACGLLRVQTSSLIVVNLVLHTVQTGRAGLAVVESQWQLLAVVALGCVGFSVGFWSLEGLLAVRRERRAAMQARSGGGRWSRSACSGDWLMAVIVLDLDVAVRVVCRVGAGGVSLLSLLFLCFLLLLPVCLLCFLAL